MIGMMNSDGGDTVAGNNTRLMIRIMEMIMAMVMVTVMTVI